MTSKVVDLSRARSDKEHERKEKKVDSIKERFARAMGMEERDRAARRRAEKKRNKKDKPRGW
ncbi:tRNA (uracil-5-)-methyltransferase [Motiliproteus sediminis]|uniref:tRNA (uracil-5-)-methyltransferase n=1 Tax=Motiliproteus sediminis TaxID=1468178 RepID=UPI001AEFD1AE|nr:tRNA (uracil-5-)-methyltransferase [Motiliproteus sediminis]